MEKVVDLHDDRSYPRGRDVEVKLGYRSRILVRSPSHNHCQGSAVGGMPVASSTRNPDIRRPAVQREPAGNGGWEPIHAPRSVVTVYDKARQSEEKSDTGPSATDVDRGRVSPAALDRPRGRHLSNGVRLRWATPAGGCPRARNCCVSSYCRPATIRCPLSIHLRKG